VKISSGLDLTSMRMSVGLDWTGRGWNELQWTKPERT